MSASVFDSLEGYLQDAVLESAYWAQAHVQAANEAALVNTVGFSEPQLPGTIFAENDVRPVFLPDNEIRMAEEMCSPRIPASAVGRVARPSERLGRRHRHLPGDLRHRPRNSGGHEGGKRRASPLVESLTANRVRKAGAGMRRPCACKKDWKQPAATNPGGGHVVRYGRDNFGVLFSGQLDNPRSFEIKCGLGLGTAFTAVGGLAVLGIYRLVPLLDRHLERSIMVWSYLAVAFIIFWGVIDRFVFSNQQPWSTTIPPLLFMIMAWFGAAFNVRLRTHLSFSEFRNMMPRTGQMACLALDAVLWFGFAVIVLVTTTRLTALSASNFQVVLGTDNVMQWWFLITAPLSFLLMSARVIENLWDDIRNWLNGEPLIEQAVIGGDV